MNIKTKSFTSNRDNLKCENREHFGNDVDAVFRVNDKDFWCRGCIKKHFPELYKDLKENGLIAITRFLRK